MNRKRRRAQASLKRGQEASERALDPTLKHLRAGRLSEADTTYKKVFAKKAADPKTLHRLGLAEYQAGRLAAAAKLIDWAISIDHRNPNLHSHLGAALQGLGRPQDAESHFRKALDLKPDYAEAHNNLGNILSSQGKLDKAAARYRRALKIKPDYAEAHSNLGVVLREQGRLEESEESFGRALELRPDYAEAHNNLGNVLKDQGRLEEAEAARRRALELKPDYPDAYNNLGNVLRDMGRPAEAEENLRRALALRPNYPDAYNNLGNVLRDQCRLEESENSYRHALELSPDHAETHKNLALLLLLRGSFPEGWEEHEWRWRAEPMRSRRRDFSVPEWNGESLEGKTILLHSEQGYGDSIQFIRYASFASTKGGQVIVECPGVLTPIIKRVEGVSGVASSLHDLPGFDFHCPLMSLPRLHGTSLETIPAQQRYMTADPKRLSDWAERLNQSGLKVGVAWAGNPKHVNDRNRSLAADHLRRLVDSPGPSFISLQVGARASDIGTLPNPKAVTDVAPFLTDLGETAAAICNLDLVICVDTAVAHLAGALGKAVWILLPYAPDWRWMLGRDDSPWYPTMRLFRQQRPGDWVEVLERVKLELRQLTGGSEG